MPRSVEPSTTLSIRAEDFQLGCPHCGCIQESLYLGGVSYDPEFRCEICDDLIRIDIQLVPAG